MSAGAKRRPASGGYVRGDEKRERIIEAALKVFGDLGYEKASTRRIAQEAGVNPPALQYYFESKEGVLRACIEYIGSACLQSMESAYAASARIGPTASPLEACDALCGILSALADWLFGSTLIEQSQRLAARMHADNIMPAFQEWKYRIAGKLHQECIRLVGIATNTSPDDQLTKLRALTMLGQVSICHMQRESTLKTLDWPDYRGERLDLLKQVVCANVKAMLGLPLSS